METKDDDQPRGIRGELFGSYVHGTDRVVTNLYDKEPPPHKPYPDIIDEFTHKRDIKRIKVKQHNAEYEAKLNVAKADVGFKITDQHGGRGVICQVVDDEYRYGKVRNVVVPYQLESTEDGIIVSEDLKKVMTNGS